MLPGAHQKIKQHVISPIVGVRPERVRGVVSRQYRSLKAYCLCGRKMMNTTPHDIKAGIQPRCDKCEEF